MTEVEIKSIASAAAKETVQEFLLVLGVNVSSAADKLELQKDFAHLRNERLTIKQVRSQIGSQVVSTLTGSFLTAVLAAVGYYVMHGPK